jgi:hypothetical protein
MGASLDSCCGQKDRNDKLEDIEKRNEKLFTFCHPKLLKEIDRRLE